jgi:hypothetical protein
LNTIGLFQLKPINMATSRQVTCIHKGDRRNQHTRITTIGGDGWKESQANAIKQIQNGTHAYWVSVGSYRTDVIIAYHNGNPYLKTKADTTAVDNLLSLPECK